MENTIEKIREKIRNNLFREALDGLAPLVRDMPQYNLTNLYGRVTRVEKQIRDGIISFNQENQEINRIRVAISQIVNELEDNSDRKDIIQEDAEENKNKQIFFLLLTLSLIPIFIWLYPSKPTKNGESISTKNRTWDINIDSLWQEANSEYALSDNSFTMALQENVRSDILTDLKTTTVIEIDALLAKYRTIQDEIVKNKDYGKEWYTSFFHDVQVMYNIKALLESNNQKKMEHVKKSKQLEKSAKNYLEIAKKHKGHKAYFKTWLEKRRIEDDIKVHLLISNLMVYELNKEEISYDSLINFKHIHFDTTYFNKKAIKYPILKKLY